jgi:hypothetical protein
MRTLFTFTFYLLLFSSCRIQVPKVGGFSEYHIGKIDSLENFVKITTVEKRTDSLYNESDQQMDSIRRNVESKMTNKNSDSAKYLADAFANLINDFSSNRARIFISGVRNGKAENGDPMAGEGLPAVCKCFQNKDSITVEFAFGFAGGIAVRQQIVGSSFHTNVSVITRHADIYKANLSDKGFKSELVVVPLMENMTLLTKPSLQIGEQLTGFVTVQSKPYFEYSGQGKADTVYLKIRYFFTCKTRKKLAAPNSGFMQ